MTTHALEALAHPLLLIVEDEPRLREMLMRFAMESGRDAQAARSAEQALKLMEQKPAQIMLLDLNLPGMHGIELFERLHQTYPQLQVIVLTGFGDLESAKRAIRLDVVDFITKPCALEDLERALARAMQRLRTAMMTEVTAQEPSAPTPAAEPAERGSTLAEVEREHIMAVLERNHGNRAAAAAELGISERTLYYRLSRYQFEMRH